jgi:hypothetical protein
VCSTPCRRRIYGSFALFEDKDKKSQMRICTLGLSGDRVSQFKTELLPVWFGTARMGSKPGWTSKNLKLFRILGVYSGSFAFIGSELADYTIFRLISRRFDEKWLLLFTNRVLAAIYRYNNSLKGSIEKIIICNVEVYYQTKIVMLFS